MATFLIVSNLAKALVVFLTVLVQINCLHAPAAGKGDLERDLSHISEHPKTAGPTTQHKHRHHKNTRPRTRASKHRHQPDQEERNYFSKAEKKIKNEDVNLEYTFLVESAKDEKANDIKTSLDSSSKDGKAKDTIKTNLDNSTKDRKAKDTIKTSLDNSTKDERPKDTIKTSLDNSTKDEKTKDIKTSLDSSTKDEKAKDTIKTSLESSTKDEKAKDTIKTGLDSSKGNYKEPIPDKKPFSEKHKSREKEKVVGSHEISMSKEPVTHAVKEEVLASSSSSEYESLFYTDTAGELHNLEGFFDDNSTSSEPELDAADVSSSSSSSYNDTSPPSSSAEHDCHECPKRKSLRESIRESRKRALQQQILFALRMEKPPNATGRRYPKAPGFMHLYRSSENMMMSDAPGGGRHQHQHGHGSHLDEDSHFRMEEEEPEEELVQTKAIYLRAQADDGSQNITDAVYFTLPEQLRTLRIKKAHLWVYINRPPSSTKKQYVELSILQIAPETRTSERVVQKPIKTKKLYTDKKHKPWRQIDVKRVLEFWAKRPEYNFGLQIRALDDNNNNLVVLPPDEEYAPIVMVSLDKNKLHSRHRRSQSLVCTENSRESRCCRYPLEIGFVELGWDWIIAPNFVRADYCSGECHMAMLDATPNSWMIQQVEGGAGSCCVPTSMQPLSLLYFDEDNTIIYQMLQNVKVSKCGCA